MHVTWANFSTENIKWHIFLSFCPCCNANLYSRMADELSKGRNSSTFKNVPIDIGVIGYGNTKTVILTKKTNNKTKQKKNRNTHYQITFEKEKFYVMYMAFACFLKQTLYLNKEHVIICLICKQPGACSARYWLFSAQQSCPVRKQNHRKGIKFYKCFDLLLHASYKNMLSKQCNRES